MCTVVLYGVPVHSWPPCSSFNPDLGSLGIISQESATTARGDLRCVLYLGAAPLSRVTLRLLNTVGTVDSSSRQWVEALGLILDVCSGGNANYKALSM